MAGVAKRRKTWKRRDPATLMKVGTQSLFSLFGTGGRVGRVYVAAAGGGANVVGERSEAF